ncbi:hypothetical protein [Bradyrhizobium sp. LVM 105]|nr:hypothetical protein [Bradyrhizobium sp. LVM 105]
MEHAPAAREFGLQAVVVGRERCRNALRLGEAAGVRRGLRAAFNSFM